MLGIVALLISVYWLTFSTFGWPLLIAVIVKGTYDILLLVNFQKVRPPEAASLPADGAQP